MTRANAIIAWVGILAGLFAIASIGLNAAFGIWATGGIA